MQIPSFFIVASVFLFSFYGNAADIKVYNLNAGELQIPSTYPLTLMGEVGNPNASIPQLTQILKSEKALHPKAQLVFKSRVQNPWGFALKFIIKYGDIPVEGNSLVATFDPLGVLKSIVHDLPNEELSLVDQMMSQEDALLSAKNNLQNVMQKLGLEVPSEVRNAELAIVQTKAGPRFLVWRMKIGAFLVDVAAAGEKQGQIVNVNTLIQDTDLEGLLGNASEASVNMMANGTYSGLLIYRNTDLTNEGQIYSFLGSDVVKRQMADSLKIVRSVVDFYASDFKLDSFNGQGQRVKVTFAQDMHNNAFWNQQVFVLPTDADSDPDMKGLGQAADVIGHEYTHAVVQYSSNLVYMGQSGALNESLADCFGEYMQMRMGLVKQPWKIGESVQSGKPFRDMQNPELGKTPQPRHMDDLKKDEFKKYVDCTRGLGADNCGVHVLSGIPNRVFSLIVGAIGWSETMAIYYPAMTLRLHQASNFRHFRNAVLDQCASQLTAEKCSQVENAFQQVGL